MLRLAAVLIPLTATCLAAPASAQQWVQCAAQGGVCDLDGVGILRYGVADRWFYRVGTDRHVCDEAVFGDPARGVAKTCQRWEMADEAARNADTQALQAQVQEYQDELQVQEQNAAALEQELEATRDELRQLLRGIRREQRRPR